MMSQRAREILIYIQRFTRENGYPPTIREIGKHFQISSTNGVRYYLNILERLGALKRLSKISRGLGVVRGIAQTGIPVLGRVAAGPGGVAEQTYDGTLDPAQLFGEADGLFALKVRGDSMMNAGILPGDYVIVKQQKQALNGELVVALVGDEATVKYFSQRRGQTELLAANPEYASIPITGQEPFELLGVVKGVVRSVSPMVLR